MKTCITTALLTLVLLTSFTPVGFAKTAEGRTKSQAHPVARTMSHAARNTSSSLSRPAFSSRTMPSLQRTAVNERQQTSGRQVSRPTRPAKSMYAASSRTRPVVPQRAVPLARQAGSKKSNSHSLGAVMQKSEMGHRTIQPVSRNGGVVRPTGVSPRYTLPVQGGQTRSGSQVRPSKTRVVPSSSLNNFSSKVQVRREVTLRPIPATSPSRSSARPAVTSIQITSPNRPSSTRNVAPILANQSIAEIAGAGRDRVKIAGPLVSRPEASPGQIIQEDRVSSSGSKERTPGQLVRGEGRTEADVLIHNPGQFMDGIEVILQNGSVGGLDGRHEGSDRLGQRGSGRSPGSTGVDAIGGLYTGPGSTSDETAKPQSQSWGEKAWASVVEFFGGGDAENPEEQGSGKVGDQMGTGFGLATSGSGVATEAISGSVSREASAGTAGRLSGGFVGAQMTVLTANTGTPEDKAMEFDGWRAFFKAWLFREAPVAGSSSMDPELAQTVYEGERFNEDQIEGSGKRPAHLIDPSRGWGTEHERKKWELAKGSGVTDPGAQSEGQTAMSGPLQSTSPLDFIADYLVPKVDRDLPTTVSDNRDHEYQENE